MIVELAVPDDPSLLDAVGRLAIAHANLEMVQVMCLKTLLGLRPGEALRCFRRTSASQVRKHVAALIQARASDEHAADREAFLALLDHARRLGDERNAQLHRFWGRDKATGGWATSPDGSRWEALPAAADIKSVADAIDALRREINTARFPPRLIHRLSLRQPA